jgi:DNA primase
MAWVDFKKLRKSLDFEKVLIQYGVTVKRVKGNRHQGFCPLPTHHGKRKTPSFSAKLDWGMWQCFGCGARGNVLEFAVRIRRPNGRARPGEYARPA